ncbi:hypothetical protein AVEN_100617-1 [Araneus ventricosus]|uniref:Uncharacterized protein n=1 Tax=Araneus ventricosus TaxID=182803 RepID=A0A4Y2F4F7_ARAVE|nr:hypothetical protein AVEN_126609-1 [Araneus ventricosus]GBM35439.1 hypothetical protein AVEN_100617-1 [Araneus ventricosus]
MQTFEIERDSDTLDSTEELVLFDYFPAPILKDDEEWKRIPTLKEIMNLIDNFVPFILFTPRADSVKYKIYYTFVKMNRLVKDNLKRCIEHNRIFGYEGISWRKPYEKYKNAMNTRHRNCDQRMHFRYREIFVSKKFFTFGKRKVARATYHIYQTLAKEMIVYILVRPDNDLERPFNPMSQ